MKSKVVALLALGVMAGCRQEEGGTQTSQTAGTGSRSAATTQAPRIALRIQQAALGTIGDRNRPVFRSSPRRDIATNIIASPEPQVGHWVEVDPCRAVSGSGAWSEWVRVHRYGHSESNLQPLSDSSPHYIRSVYLDERALMDGCAAPQRAAAEERRRRENPQGGVLTVKSGLDRQLTYFKSAAVSSSELLTRAPRPVVRPEVTEGVQTSARTGEHDPNGACLLMQGAKIEFRELGPKDSTGHRFVRAVRHVPPDQPWQLAPTAWGIWIRDFKAHFPSHRYAREPGLLSAPNCALGEGYVFDGHFDLSR